MLAANHAQNGGPLRRQQAGGVGLQLAEALQKGCPVLLPRRCLQAQAVVQQVQLRVLLSWQGGHVLHHLGLQLGCQRQLLGAADHMQAGGQGRRLIRCW